MPEVALFAWALLYALGARRMARREILFFAAGWSVVAAAELSPLHELGHRSFAWHMAEHMVLMSAAAPLLVLGRPLVALLWAAPRAWRPALGKLSRLGHPAFAFLLYAGALWIWHLPPAMDAAVHDHAIHFLQHTSFLAAALAWWWSLERAGPGLAIVSLFLTSVHSGFLGALLTIAVHPLYHSYPDLGDQQLAGLVMWIPASSIHLGAALFYAALWLRRADARTGNIPV
jgi:cytochrome c oxidase assembly factor CtaG